MYTILIIEDDRVLNLGMQECLKEFGYKVVGAQTGETAIKIVSEECIDLAVLDVNLPDMDGFQICKEIKNIRDVPIVFLTVRDEEQDIVAGFDMGAEDYITKPFSLMVLVSKVNALMRRIDSTEEYKSVMVCGDMELNLREMKVYKRGKEISLSKKEMQLLTYLWENAGQIVSKDSILGHVWDVDGQFVDENTVTVNISRLKNKLLTDAISNVRGLGYIWTEKVIRK